MKKFIVITSISHPTKGLKKFSKMEGWDIVLVGDKKTPSDWFLPNVRYLSPKDQERLGYEIIKFLPWNHYSRKMIGYLYAIEHGADIIFETDDDNIPLDNWALPNFISEKTITSRSNFINIYNYFTEDYVWPRGFPLAEISKNTSFSIVNNKNDIAVWQGLANKDPDVDAIFRLVFNKEINFNNFENISIQKNIYCPFNSQNTFWKKEFFPLLYLPSTVTFRFTDILRGYVAQRIIWNYGATVGFTGPSVYQERNKHNLINDFKEEIPFYVEIENIVKILDSIKTKNMDKSLIGIYKNLNNNNHVRTEEIKILNAWITDVKNLLK
ncbi:MAG: STELLO glycosyltransferase family protein [Candidatus Pacebacteria bacterium]|nr:STELLO glycosyltransferase family protein [Candidatus Paceibacterota bacterium]